MKFYFWEKNIYSLSYAELTKRVVKINVVFFLVFFFFVACIAWQTHRDHVVHPRHFRRRLSVALAAEAVSSSHFSFPFSNF